MKRVLCILLSACLMVTCLGGIALAEEEPIVLQLWTSNEEVVNNPEAFYLQKLEKDFNVKFDIKVRAVGGSDYTDWLNISLMSGDEPEWIRDQTIGQATYTQYVEEGLLLQLDEDMIRENMPNYMAWTAKYANIFGENPFNLYQVDGGCYSIPDAKVDLSTFCYVGFREEWMKALGIEKTPETLDEMVDFMRKATFNDPDGNGVNDTYGYLGITNTPTWAFSPIFGAYGVYPGLFYAKDDKVIFGSIEPETKEALAFLRDLYAEGIIDPEWVTLGFDQVMNKVVSGKIGCTWQNWLTFYDNNGMYQNITDAPDASWAATSGPIGADGQQGIMNFNPLAGVGLMFTSKMEGQEEKLAKYLQVFDAIMGDPTYYEAEIWGLEGTTFTKDENGNRAYVDGMNADELFKFGVGADYRFPSLEIFGYDPDIHDAIDFDADKLALRSHLIEISRGQYNIMGNFDRPVYREYSSELPDAEAVFTDIILGNTELDSFDTFVADWLAAGGTEIMEEAQALYDAYLK